MAYTGLQPFLGADITARVTVANCPGDGFSGPEINLDCEGKFCQLLTQSKTCNSDSDCTGTFGPGVSCIDLAANMNGGFDLFRGYFGQNIFATADNTFGLNSFKADFATLKNAFPGIDTSLNPTNPFKICTVNFTSIGSNNRTDGFNVTKWVADQFVVDGSVASNAYIIAWQPPSNTQGTGTGDVTQSPGYVPPAILTTSGAPLLKAVCVFVTLVLVVMLL